MHSHELDNGVSWVEYNPKKVVSQHYKDISLSPRFIQTNVAIRWHFYVDAKFLEVLQAQSLPQTTEVFRDFVYDTNEFTLLKNGFWLLLRTYDNKPSCWRLRQVKKNDEELYWTELKGDDKSILELLSTIFKESKQMVRVHFLSFKLN